MSLFKILISSISHRARAKALTYDLLLTLTPATQGSGLFTRNARLAATSEPLPLLSLLCHAFVLVLLGLHSLHSFRTLLKCHLGENFMDLPISAGDDTLVQDPELPTSFPALFCCRTLSTMPVPQVPFIYLSPISLNRTLICCSQQNPQSLQQCLAYSWHSANICGAGVNDPFMKVLAHMSPFQRHPPTPPHYYLK